MVSLVTFKKFVDTPLRFFPLLVAYTLFNEILGYFIINFEEFSFFDEPEYQWHNVVIYNLYQLIFFGYLFWLYHEVVKTKIYRLAIVTGAVVTGLAYLISIFFQDPLHSSLYYADCIGCVVVIIAIFLHLKELSKTKGRVNRYNLMVWINSGMLLFHTYFPYYILNGYLNVEFYLDYHLRQVLWIVVSIMYCLFIIGFLISRRNAFH